MKLFWLHEIAMRNKFHNNRNALPAAGRIISWRIPCLPTGRHLTTLIKIKK
jgi:hypothetical protein